MSFRAGHRLAFIFVSTKGICMQANRNMKERLLNALPQFGLNPRDWRLHKVNSKNYVIKNLHDEEICLWGQVNDEETPDWQDLQWLRV